MAKASVWAMIRSTPWLPSLQRDLRRVGRDALLSLTIASLILHPGVVRANPQGGVVVSGQAEFSGPAESLTVTNAPGTIIEWQAFSIAQHEITRFVQENAQSAVLNRVVGESLSEVLGRLESNGQVFLINPNGIVVGSDAVIDTAGFVASTLGMSDADFLSGRMAFEDGAHAGAVRNGGVILAREGSVIIVAPVIENSGLVRADNGDLILAAGRKVLVTDANLAGVTFEVQAPTDRVLNLGRLIARGGSIAAFGGTLGSSGTIDADSVSVGAGGEIILGARGDITLEAGSVTTASGAAGGNIFIESIGTSLIGGAVRAEGTAGTGGTVDVLGAQVGVIGSGLLSADGAAGGGAIHLGGNYLGQGPLPNARAAYVGADARVSASATGTGRGGEVIVWSEELTKVYGAITARGANDRGGFVETSSAQVLDVRGRVDVSGGSALGEALGGTWLLDPLNLTIVAGGGQTGVSEVSANIFQPFNSPSTIGVDVITAAMTGGVNLILDTNVSGGEQGDITLATAFDIDATTGTNTLILQSAGNILINAPIFDSTPGGQVFAVDFRPSSGFETQIGASITDLGARSDFAGVTRFVANAAIQGPDIGFFALTVAGVTADIIGSIGVVDIMVGTGGVANFTGLVGATGLVLIDSGGLLRSNAGSGFFVATTLSVDGALQVVDSLQTGTASVSPSGVVSVGGNTVVNNSLGIAGAFSTTNLSATSQGVFVDVLVGGSLQVDANATIDELYLLGTLGGAGTTTVNAILATGDSDVPTTTTIDTQTLVLNTGGSGLLHRGSLVLAGSGALINRGSTMLSDDLVISGSGLLRNEAALEIAPASTGVQVGARFEQQAGATTTFADNASLFLNGGGDLAGTFLSETSSSDAALVLGLGNFVARNGTSILESNNNAITSLNGASALLLTQQNATVSIGELRFNAGGLVIDAGSTLNVSGDLHWTSGAILAGPNGVGDVVALADLQVLSGGGKLMNVGRLRATGTATVSGDIDLANDAVLEFNTTTATQFTGVQLNDVAGAPSRVLFGRSVVFSGNNTLDLFADFSGAAGGLITFGGSTLLGRGGAFHDSAFADVNGPLTMSGAFEFNAGFLNVMATPVQLVGANLTALGGFNFISDVVFDAGSSTAGTSFASTNLTASGGNSFASGYVVNNLATLQGAQTINGSFVAAAALIQNATVSGTGSIGSGGQINIIDSTVGGISFNAATVDFSGTSVFNSAFSAGSVNVNSGSLEVASSLFVADTLSLTLASLTGAGAVTVANLTNAVQSDIDLTAGLVTGDLQMVLGVNLGGTTVSATDTFIASSSSLALAGTLTTTNLTMLPGAVSGSGTINVNGTLTINPDRGFAQTFDGVRVNLNNIAFIAPSVILGNGAVLDVNGTAFFDGDVLRGAGAAPEFRVDMIALFNNDARVDAPLFITGFVDMVAGAQLDIAGGGVATGGGFIMRGDATRAALVFSAPYAVGSTTQIVDQIDSGAYAAIVPGGVLDVTSDALVERLSVEGGDVRIADDATLFLITSTNWSAGNFLRGATGGSIRGNVRVVGDMLVASAAAKAIDGVRFSVDTSGLLDVASDLSLLNGGNLVVDSSRTSIFRDIRLIDGGGAGSVNILGNVTNDGALPLIVEVPISVDTGGVFQVQADVLLSAGSLLANGGRFDLVGPGDLVFGGGSGLYELRDGGIVSGGPRALRLLSGAQLNVVGAGNVIDRLQMFGGVVDSSGGTGPLDIGLFEWNGGVLAGGGAGTRVQSLSIQAGSFHDLVGGHVLRVDNTSAAPASVWSSGVLNVGTGSALLVERGQFNVVSGAIGLMGPGSFGVGSIGTVDIDTRIDIDTSLSIATGGQVRANGSVRFLGGGQVQGLLESIGFTELASGNFALSAGGTIRGDVSNLLLSNGATVSVAGGETGNLVGARILGGVLDVPGALALSGRWEDGTFQGPVGGRILANAAFELAEGSVGKQLFGGVVLDIGGTTNWFGGDVLLDGGATIEVHDAGALVLGDGSGSTASLRVGGGGGGQLRLLNGGALVLQSAMGGTTRIDAGLFADGPVRVQSGTLELAGGSDLQRVASVAGGMNLRFVAGLHQLRNGAGFVGRGLTSIDGGVLQIGGGDVVRVATQLRLAGGELANSGQLDAHEGVVLAGGRISGAGTSRLYAGLLFEAGQLLGVGQTIVRGGELRFDTAADKDIGGGHALTFDPGPGLDWKLSNVVFEDGGTATGHFHFDSATDTVTSWGVQTTGGDLQTFPETLYANGLPGHSGISGFVPQQILLGQPGPSMIDRQLRMRPVLALGEFEQTIPIDLTGGQGHEECFNCAPVRNMVSGELLGIRPMANWVDGVVRLSNGSRLEIASGNLDVSTPAGIDLQTGAGGGVLQVGAAGTVAILGMGNRAIAAGLDLAGELIVHDGALQLAGGGSVRGVLGADTGGQLDFTVGGSTLLLQDGAQVGTMGGATARIGAGTLTVAPGETARSVFDGILVDGRLELGAGSVLLAEFAMASPSHLVIAAGAQIVGAGTVAIDGMSSLDILGDFVLDGATLQNGGSATWTGIADLANGASFRNAGALAIIGSALARPVPVTGGALRNVAGGVLGVGAGAQLRVDTPFENDGAIDVNEGLLVIAGGGRLGGQVDLVSAVAAIGLDVIGGAVRLDNGLQVRGGSEFAGGRLRLAAPMVDLQPGASVFVTGLVLDGARIDLRGGTMSLSGDWRQGVFANGQASVPGNSTFAVASTGAHALEDASLVVGALGTLVLPDTSIDDVGVAPSVLQLNAGASLQLTGSALASINTRFDALPTSSITGSGGSLSVTAGLAETAFDLGTGTLVVSPGPFGSDYRFGVAAVTGMGGLRVQGGLIDVLPGGALDVMNLRITAGGVMSRAGASGALTVSGAFEWFGGGFTGNGSVNVLGATSIRSSAAKILDGFVLDISGADWTGGGLDLRNGAQLTSSTGTLLASLPAGLGLTSSDATGSVLFAGSAGIEVMAQAPGDDFVLSADLTTPRFAVTDARLVLGRALDADVFETTDAILAGTGSGGVTTRALVAAGSALTLDALLLQAVDGNLQLPVVTLRNGSVLGFDGALDSRGSGTFSVDFIDGGGANLLSLGGGSMLEIDGDASWTVRTAFSNLGQIHLMDGNLVLRAPDALLGGSYLLETVATGSHLVVQSGETRLGMLTIAAMSGSSLRVEGGVLGIEQNAARDLANLDLTGGALRLADGAVLTVNGLFDWRGGAVDRAAGSTGPATIIASGLLDVGAGGAKSLLGTRLELRGTGLLRDDLLVRSNSTLRVNGGTLALAGGGLPGTAADGTLSLFGGVLEVQNARSAGIGLAISADADGAALSRVLLRPGASLALTSDASWRDVDFDIDAGAALLFQAGLHVFDGGQMLGTGERWIGPGASIGTSTFASLDGLVLDGGFIGGSGDFVLTDLEWRSGTFGGAGSAQLDNLHLTSAGNHRVTSGYRLGIAGGQWDGGDLQLQGGANVDLLAGAPLLVSGAGRQLVADAAIGNRFRVQSGAALSTTGTLALRAPVVNAGLIVVDGGTIVIGDDSAATGGTGDGEFAATAGGRLVFGAGAFALADGARLRADGGDIELRDSVMFGPAMLRVAGGNTVSVLGTEAAGGRLLLGGDLLLDGTLAVVAGGPQLHFLPGARVDGTGSLAAEAVEIPAALSIAGAHLSAAQLAVRAGASLVSDADIDAGELDVAGSLAARNLTVSGVTRAIAGSLLADRVQLADLALDNAAQLQLRAGSGTSTITGTTVLDGRVDVGTGQLLRLTGVGGARNVLTGDGRIEIDNTGFVFGDGLRFEGAGDRRVSNAVLAATATPVVVDAGSVLVLDGNLSGSGQLLVLGALGTEGSVNVAGSVTIAAGAQMQVSADTASDAAFGMLTNRGEVRLGDAVNGHLDARLAAGSLVNTGTISALAGAGARVLDGLLANTGTLAVDGGVFMLLGNGMFLNRGALIATAGGDFLLPSFTSFDHDGVLTLSSGSLFDLPLGTFLYRGGSVTGGMVDALAVSYLGGTAFAAALVADSLDVSAGSVFDVGDATVASVINRGTLNLGGTLTTSGGLTNMGTVRGSGALVGALMNMSTFDVTGGLSIDALGGTVTNSGVLIVGSGQTLAVNNGSFANSGTLSLGNGARLDLAGDFDWTGGALSGGSIVVAGDVVLGGGTSHALGSTLQASSVDIGAGERLVLGAGAILDAGDLRVAGSLMGSGTALVTRGDLSISGDADLGSLRVGGDLRVMGGALTAGGTSVSSALIDGGSVVSLGVLTSGGGVVVDGTGTVLSLAGLAASALDLGGGSRTTLAGTATLRADITLDGGARLQLADAIVMAGLRIDDGMVTGIGTINGDVLNSGMVSIGNSPGVLVVNGDFTQMADGMLVLEIGGPGSFAAGVNYDQLVVNGTANFAGTLQFVQLDDFVSFADRGDLTPVTYNAVSGAFTSISLVGDPDFDPEIEFGPTRAIANAVVVPPGDPEENSAEVTQDVAELADQQEELENCGAEEDEATVETQAADGHGVGCRGG